MNRRAQPLLQLPLLAALAAGLLSCDGGAPSARRGDAEPTRPPAATKPPRIKPEHEAEHEADDTRAGNGLRQRVVKVIDGDSLVLRAADGGRTYEVRLYGIDAPEYKQAGGKQARRALDELVYNKRVTIRQVDEDTHGRVVAWVDLGETSANLYMLRQGHAWWFKRYAEDETALQQAAAEARAARRGLWAADRPTPPWKWRRDHPRE
jgi:endonuclease YncB( thermonuclease family)